LFDGYHRVSGSKRAGFPTPVFWGSRFFGPRVSVPLRMKDDNSDWILQILV
jgi:hypothetical protein